VAFADSTSLANICSLPKSTGDSIQFIAGYFPTPSAASGTTQSALSTAESSIRVSAQTTSVPGVTSASNNDWTITRTTIITSSPSSTGTDPLSASHRSGLSSGTKIGIGIGAAIGALVLIAVIAALLFFRRKRRRSAPEIEKVSSNSENVSDVPTKLKEPEIDGQLISEADGKPVSKADRPDVLESGGQQILEADGNAARPWSMRSELEGSQVVPISTVGDAGGGRVRRSGDLNPIAEMPGSNNWHGRDQSLVQEEQGPPHGSEPLQWGAAWRV
jgi:hypothetical protein